MQASLIMLNVECD